MKTLSNVAEIVDVLGGPDKLAKLTKAKDPAVWNWINSFKKFPANTYWVMITALEELGYTASPRLWKMRGVPKMTTRLPKVAAKKRAA